MSRLIAAVTITIFAINTAQAAEGQPPKKPAKIWNRTDPLGETPKRITDQGQRVLTLRSGKDWEHVFIVPTTSAAFHGHAVFVGVLFQQGQREAIQPSEVLSKTLITDA